MSENGEEDQEAQEGTQIRVLSKYGYSYRSLLSVEMVDDAIMINWRSYPEKLGAEIFYVKTMTMSKARLTLLFEESFELSIEFDDEDTCDAMHSCLEALHLEALEMEKEKRDLPKTNIMSKPMQESRHAAFQVVASQEMLYQLTACLRLKEGDLVYRRLVAQRDDRQLSTAFYRWTHFVKHHNLTHMNRDRHRWRLHAIANQELDLQAWYHAVFYSEVYRLRGPFWYKDALLPSYRTSYDIVDNTLTPLEEAALAHVLCSPDTVYADVAGQMFVVQALTTPQQFSLFQGLASQGSSVTKYPRQGNIRPEHDREPNPKTKPLFSHVSPLSTPLTNIPFQNPILTPPSSIPFQHTFSTPPLSTSPLSIQADRPGNSFVFPSWRGRST